MAPKADPQEQETRRGDPATPPPAGEKALLSAVADAAFDAVLVFEEGVCRHQNAAARTLFGVAPAEGVGRPVERWFADEDRVAVAAHLSAERSTVLEVRGRHQDGARFTCEIRVRMVAEGSRRLQIMAVRDTSERLRAQALLRDSERRYRALFESSADALLVGKISPDGGVFTDCNDSACRLYQCRREQLVGRSPMDFSPRTQPDGNLSADRIAEKLLAAADGRQQQFYWQHRRRDGTRFDSEVTLNRLQMGGEDYLQASVRDITERLRAEVERQNLHRQLQQAQKMEALGTLASGVAHELNNPLAGVMQNLAVLANRLFEDLPANHTAAERAGTSLDALQRYLHLRKLPATVDQIRSSGMRAGAIIKNMLGFARSGAAAMADHDVGALLDRSVALAEMNYTVGKKMDFKQIEVIRDYADADTTLHCDGGKLQQVFLNLLINGADAMADQADRHAPPRFILRVKREAAHVRVEIEDNGTGMDEATIRSAFEPFFTTKPVGEGTGLGLAIAYYIVTQDHGGAMRVEASDSGGARFILLLPVSGGLVESGRPLPTRAGRV